MEGKRKLVAVACQGGGSHTAYTAGVLDTVLGSQIDQDYHLVGMSGTSGGALCALVAWYGLLKGGERAAQSGLKALWEDNAAHGLWEALWNAGTVLASELPMEVRMTPYAPPLSTILEWAQVWAPRPQWVDLRLLIARHVQFAAVRTLGAFEHLQDDVGMWLCADELRAQHLAALGPVPLAPREPPLDPALILKAIADVRGLAGAEGGAGGFLAARDLALDLRQVEEIIHGARQPWARDEVDRLRLALRAARARIPLLLVGAADIASGEFMAFSSKRNEITVEAICASAAIPWVFKAVHGRYWDGLFSQNPPIRQFMTEPDSAAHKPDEIWIVQINPQQDLDAPPTTAGAILERRNQLAGNLSLNQEIYALKATNRRLGEAVLAAGGRYKPETIHWIRMHAPTLERRWTMDPASKLNRDPAFLAALREHGAQQARRFLPIRGFIEDVWKEPDAKARRAAAQARCTRGSGVQALLATVEGFHEALENLHLTIDGMDIVPAATNEREAIAGSAVLAWSGQGMRHGKQVVLQGQADFVVEGNRITGGGIRDIVVTRVREVSGEVGASAEVTSYPA